jgi:hypothetical protein
MRSVVRELSEYGGKVGDTAEEQVNTVLKCLLAIWRYPVRILACDRIRDVLSEISGYNGVEYEDGSLLRYFLLL